MAHEEPPEVVSKPAITTTGEAGARGTWGPNLQTTFVEPHKHTGGLANVAVALGERLATSLQIGKRPYKWKHSKYILLVLLVSQSNRSNLAHVCSFYFRFRTGPGCSALGGPVDGRCCSLWRPAWRGQAGRAARPAAGDLGDLSRPINLLVALCWPLPRQTWLANQGKPAWPLLTSSCESTLSTTATARRKKEARQGDDQVWVGRPEPDTTTTIATTNAASHCCRRRLLAAKQTYHDRHLGRIYLPSSTSFLISSPN